jgi:hypothetical protein
MIARSKIGAKIEKKGPLSISIEKVLKKGIRDITKSGTNRMSLNRRC